MTVYIINSCNEWHEYSSFRLITVVTESNLQKALNLIKKRWKYSDDDMEKYIDVTSTELTDYKTDISAYM